MKTGLLNVLTICAVTASVWCMVSCNGQNEPEAVKKILLTEGCYQDHSGNSFIVFPKEQHGGTHVAVVTNSDSALLTMQPVPLGVFNDTVGKATFALNDIEVALATNGKDTVWLTAEGETSAFVLQPESQTAPKKLTGKWKMSIELNEYMSYKLWEASISDALECDVTFNIPDSTALMAMLSAAALLNDMPDVSELLPEGLELTPLLSALPTHLSGEIWYSAAGGRGIFVPEVNTQAVEYEDVGLYFTTPSSSIIRFAYKELVFDMQSAK